MKKPLGLAAFAAKNRVVSRVCETCRDHPKAAAALAAACREGIDAGATRPSLATVHRWIVAEYGYTLKHGSLRHHVLHEPAWAEWGDSGA